MYILYISNYKKKFALFFCIALLWVVMFLLACYLIPDNLLFSITIDRHIQLRCPLDFEISQVFVNDQLSEAFITSSLPSKAYSPLKFSSYESLAGKFTFSYPSLFSLNPQELGGSDILYHIDFSNKSKTVHGFVQVWNMPYSLKEFLEKSKSASQQNYQHFSSTSITINGIPGYLWDYSLKGDNGTTYRSMEVFLKKEGKMYRISYFARGDEWNEKQEDIFWKMVYSFKINK